MATGADVLRRVGEFVLLEGASVAEAHVARFALERLRFAVTLFDVGLQEAVVHEGFPAEFTFGQGWRTTAAATRLRLTVFRRKELDRVQIDHHRLVLGLFRIFGTCAVFQVIYRG